MRCMYFLFNIEFTITKNIWFFSVRTLVHEYYVPSKKLLFFFIIYGIMLLLYRPVLYDTWNCEKKIGRILMNTRFLGCNGLIFILSLCNYYLVFYYGSIVVAVDDLSDITHITHLQDTTNNKIKKKQRIKLLISFDLEFSLNFLNFLLLVSGVKIV